MYVSELTGTAITEYCTGGSGNNRNYFPYGSGSRKSKIKVLAKVLSPEASFPLFMKLNSQVRLFETPWTVAHQAPLSLVFSRQEHWSGLPFPSPGGLPDARIEPGSPSLQAESLPSEPPEKRSHAPPRLCSYHIQISSFDKDTSHIGLEPTVRTSLKCNYLFKRPYCQ